MMTSYVPAELISDALSTAEALVAEGRAATDLVYRLRAVRDNACADPSCQTRCLVGGCQRPWPGEVA